MMPTENIQTSSPTEQEVLHALRWVVDPEIGVNIVDLGLIYQVDISDQGIEVKMTMTTPACPLHTLIVSQVDTLLRRKFSQAGEINVTLVWDPPWEPELMSEAARRQLGWLR